MRCTGSWDGEDCGVPAVIALTVACIHEHIGHDFNCDRCMRATLRTEAQGILACLACFEGPDHHHCPVTVTFRALEPSEMIA